ncbi:MAG: ABC transporter ATP-binding protein [Candidatus Pelethousia sp.]|nr:ABC transporter ATP-binding protein [Candidatus Pelethousia sp.]
MELLELREITKAFPGVVANNRVNLHVKAGEIHALLGENGAGKTTLMNILYGLYHADSGSIYWKGEKVDFLTPSDAIAAGIGMVHQHFTLIPTMSVMHNIILGLKEKGYPFIKSAEVIETIQSLARRYGLAVDAQKKVSELSVGQQQRVEILKQLYRGAELLVLDEPTAVLTPGETREFFDVLRRLKAEGHAVILITHRMSEIMAVSDRVTILRNGTNVADMLTADTDPASLARLMMGGELPERPVFKPREEGDLPLLDMREIVVKKDKIAKLSLSLRVYPGEIIGIAGVDGNGQKELAEVICGILPATQGKIIYDGRDVSKASIRQRFRAGIAYISDDRHQDGLILDMNLRQNLMLRKYGVAPFARHGCLNKQQMEAFSASCIKKYQIKAPSSETKMRLLSGGNQQKAILAREISEDARFIVACQPTRGLDIGATMQVRNILAEQRNRGAGVLLISADLDEIRSLSDRVAVLFRGRLMGIVDNGPALTTQILGRMMGGHSLQEGEADHA